MPRKCGSCGGTNVTPAAGCQCSVIAGANTTVTGTGDAGDPFVVNSTAAPETALVVTTDGTAAGVTQSGTANHTVNIALRGDDADNVLTTDPSNGGLHLDCADINDCVNISQQIGAAAATPVTGTGTAADPFLVAIPAETVTTLVANADGTHTYTSENGTVTIITPGSDSLVANADGSFTHTAVDGTVVVIPAAGAAVHNATISNTISNATGTAIGGTGTVADPYLFPGWVGQFDAALDPVDDALVTGTGTATDPFQFPIPAPLVVTTDGTALGVTQNALDDHTVNITVTSANVNNMLGIDLADGGTLGQFLNSDGEQYTSDGNGTIVIPDCCPVDWDSVSVAGPVDSAGNPGPAIPTDGNANHVAYDAFRGIISHVWNPTTQLWVPVAATASVPFTITDHHSAVLTINDGDNIPLQDSLVIGAGHVPAGEIGVSLIDSSDAALTSDPHHTIGIIGSTGSTASGAISSVISAQNGTASGGPSLVAASFGATASAAQSAVIGGFGGQAQGTGSVVFGGINSTALGDQSGVMAANTSTASGPQSGVFAADGSTASGQQSAVVAGFAATASGVVSFATGRETVASGGLSFASGGRTTASGIGAASFNGETVASGLNSAAFGIRTQAQGPQAFTAGTDTIASNIDDFAIGNTTVASGTSSFASGGGTTASGIGAASFNGDTVASGENSAAFGLRSQAIGPRSFVMGTDNQALDQEDFAGGELSVASGTQSIAYGFRATASGSASAAFNGLSLAADDESFSVSNGQANTGVNGTFAHGNGTITPGFFVPQVNVGFRGAPPQPARVLVTLADVILALQEQGLGL